MRTRRAFLKTTGIFPAFFFVAVPTLAQSPALPAQEYSAPETAPAGDDDPTTPPAKGAIYARLRQFEGGISLKREDENASQDLKLEINSPLIPGDQVWTGEDGRMEVQLADGTLLRLDHGSRLSLLNLADREATFDNTTLVRLMNGSLYVRADNFDAHNRRFQIDTPAGSVFLLSGGVFRLDVGPDGVSTVASYRGVAEILSEDVSVMAHSGERVTAEPGRRPAEARAFNTLRRDPFDAWVEGRDDAYAAHDSDRGERPEVPAPVSPYVSELSRYGAWRMDPSYGWVWVPGGVASDWRPYYYGQWYSAPIGMTWVSYEPWGWAPYHYGRWQWGLGVGWFWIPGIVYSGAHVSWSIGPSTFGWCPLGFYDTPVYYNSFYPWVYVPHTHIYYHNVYRHAYSYSDVARYRLEQNSVVLRRQPYARPGGRPDAIGPATYRRALADPRLVQGKPGAVAGGDSGKTPFKLNEQRTYRRAVISRQATLERTAGAGGATITPVSARPLLTRTGGPSFRRIPGAPRAQETGGVAARPDTVAQPSAPGKAREISVDEPVSPATGRPIRPPVRMLPESGKPLRAGPKAAAGRDPRDPYPMDPEPRARVKRPGQSGLPAAQAPATRPPRPADRPADPPTTPHPRADAGRGGSGGRPFVMPARPPRGSAPKSGVVHAPTHPAPKAQVAEKPKSGGRRK